MDQSSTPQHPAPAPPGSAPAGQDQLLDLVRHATLGEYDIYGELGRGGMATVYLAHEIALDRKVAIKVMSPALVFGAGMVERFRREARTAANLSHPNIIPIYAVREAGGLLFFVMKLIEGTPLDSIMRELGKLPIPMVEALLAQVGGALGYAHRRGVIHRDIKPGNILIDDEGWAVVTDFGIAKVQEMAALTQSGSAVGTPTYMSPEQCSGLEVGGASDQYSLGVVTYEMLAGRPPFQGPSMMALMYSHFHDAVPGLEQYRPDCPEPLRVALARMLEKDPAARWPSMEEAIAAMGARQLAHDDPTRSQLILLARSGTTHKVVSQVQTPRSPIPLARKPTGEATPVPVAPPRAGRRAWLVGAAGLAALGVSAALFLAPSKGTSPPAPAPPPPPPPPAPTEASSPATVPPAAPDPTAPAPGVTRTPDRRPPAVRRPAGSAPSSQPAPAPAPVPSAGTPTQGAPRTEPANIPVPVPAAPAPPPAAALPPSPAAPVTKPAPEPPDEKAAVTEVLMAYARALDAGDLVQVRLLYPSMSTSQRQGLEAFWRAGGTMRTRWSVSGVRMELDEATARIQGSTVVSMPRERPTEQRVDLRARLERRGTEWRILALVN